MAPQPGAWLGSDHLGRDELSRLIVGSQISIYVGLLSVGIGVTLGALIGILSAYIGGVVDLAIQRLVDSMMAFPPIILALGLVAVLGGSANNVIIALLVILLPGTIRVIRSQVLSIKELDYTLAATAIGAGSIRIMLRHILPNVIASYIVLGTITLGFAIIIEASLSFLGVGVPPDIPTWGGMLTRGTEEIRIAWWLAVFPGIAISVVVFAINFLGDALRIRWIRGYEDGSVLRQAQDERHQKSGRIIIRPDVYQLRPECVRCETRRWTRGRDWAG